MEAPELAGKVVTRTAGVDHSKCGYYMTNINHPVIFALKKRYCGMKKINPHLPMSDQDRTEFELWLFQPSIRRMIEDFLEGKEQVGEENTSDPKADRG